MHTLQAVDLLRVWEMGRDRPNWQRALLMLAPCFPDARPSALAAFSVARRNRLLLALRESTVGPTLQCLVRCPLCHAPLEFTTTANELLGEDGSGPEAEEGMTHVEGLPLPFRIPDSHDLAAAGLLDVESATDELFHRAVPLAGAGEGALASPRAAAVASALETTSPAIDLRIPLRCVCDHVWAASLDIAAFLWIEIDRLARRLLDDVQAIARGYGWHEADILAMSESRRRFYLEALDA